MSFLEPLLAKPIMKINLQAWNTLRVQDEHTLDDKCFMAAEVLRESGTFLAICTEPHIVKMAVRYGVEPISVSGPSSSTNPA